LARKARKVGVSYIVVDGGRRIFITTRDLMELEEKLKEKIVGEVFLMQNGKIVKLMNVKPEWPIRIGRKSRGGMLGGLFAKFRKPVVEGTFGSAEEKSKAEEEARRPKWLKLNEEEMKRKEMKYRVPFGAHMNASEFVEAVQEYEEKRVRVRELLSFADWFRQEFPKEFCKIDRRKYRVNMKFLGKMKMRGVMGYAEFLVYRFNRFNSFKDISKRVVCRL
jgi:hypothetical protein